MQQQQQQQTWLENYFKQTVVPVCVDWPNFDSFLKKKNSLKEWGFWEAVFETLGRRGRPLSFLRLFLSLLPSPNAQRACHAGCWDAFVASTIIERRKKTSGTSVQPEQLRSADELFYCRFSRFMDAGITCFCFCFFFLIGLLHHSIQVVQSTRDIPLLQKEGEDHCSMRKVSCPKM